MGLIFTQLVAYSEIEVNDTDLFEDAFGIRTEFSDVIDLLKTASFEPDKDLVKRLMGRIREN